MASSPRRRSPLQPEALLHDHPATLRATLVLWALSAFLFIALAIPLLADIVQSVDDAMFDAMVWAEWPPVVALARVLDAVGTVWVTLPIIVAVGAWLAWRRRWNALASWVLAMIVSQLFIGPVKDLYERVRPPDSLVETTSWSFPSGHSVVGAAIAISLVIVLVRPGPQRRNLEILAAAFAVVMALSRVYLRAHWLTDVAAGAALGAAVAIGAAALVHLIDDRRHGKAHRDHAV